MAAASLVYAAGTAGGPHRPALCAITLASALGALAVHRLPPRRLVDSGHDVAFMSAWNAVHVAAAAVLVILDGGLLSPYVAIFYLSVAFAAVSLPRRRVIAIAGLNLVALAACGLADPDQAGAWTSGVAVRGAALVAIAGVAATIADDRLRRLVALQDSKEEMLRRLARVVEYRDNDTGDHVERMSAYCEQLELAATVAVSHHERFDGAGYPAGLRGEEIPLAGRIVAVADVFDALTSRCVYKDAMGFEAAAQIIREGAGTQFDPAVVEAFVAQGEAIRAIHGGDRPAGPRVLARRRELSAGSRPARPAERARPAA